MRAKFTKRLAGLAAIAVAALTLAGAAAAQAAPHAPGVATASPAYTPPAGIIDPCPQAAPGDAGCAALTTEPAAGAARPAAGTTTPAGLSPANLQHAYDLQGSRSGSGQTVAVVTAYDDSTAASDLATYRSQYGLRPCTTADNCFEKVSQTGSTTTLPGISAGWSVDASVSMDMISAICPNCHILLVEANSPAMTDFGAAENEAVALGAHFVDNDWIIPEAQLGAEETSYDTQYFDHPGVAITAPAGNAGYGTTYYPAASPYVTAVGGTTLTADSSVPSGYTEAAWIGTSSGCSLYESKPSWQTDTGCLINGTNYRTLNDLAADAGTSVAYYDTPTIGNWAEGSGTTVSAAIVAASYALAGTPASGTNPASYPYEYPGGSYTTPGNAYPYSDGLNNITSGPADGTCSISYLCTPGPGYNGPTGLGSPNTALALNTGGESGTFQSHAAANLCLDDYNAITTAGTRADVAVCGLEINRYWTAHPNGTITTNVASDVCLDTAGGGTTSGTDAVINPCSGAASQQWTLTSTDEIINAQSGLCLTDPGDATVNGTQLKIETCASSPATDQQWTAPYDRPTASGPITSQIAAAHPFCVDDTGDSSANANKIQIWGCAGNPNQHWTIEADGTIQINGKCLVTDKDGTSNGTLIYLYTCTGDTGQQWTEQSDGTLVNTRSGTCLQDPYASTTNGTQLQIWTCGGAIQERWNLP
jgi:hypothetical protein